MTNLRLAPVEGLAVVIIAPFGSAPEHCQPTFDFVDIVRIHYAQLDPGRKRGCGLYRSELSNVGCESGIARRTATRVVPAPAS